MKVIGKASRGNLLIEIQASELEALSEIRVKGNTFEVERPGERSKVTINANQLQAGDKIQSWDLRRKVEHNVEIMEAMDERKRAIAQARKALTRLESVFPDYGQVEELSD